MTTQRQERNFLSGLLERLGRAGPLSQTGPSLGVAQQRAWAPTPEEEEELAYQRFLEQTYADAAT